MFAARSTVLARSIVRSTGAAQVRGIHFENVVGKTMPFSVKSKPATALKIAAFTITGFGLPFVAAAHHIAKSSGSG